jgi:hypothetical protein
VRLTSCLVCGVYAVGAASGYDSCLRPCSPCSPSQRNYCEFLFWYITLCNRGRCAMSVGDGIGGSSSVDLFQDSKCELGGGRSGLPRSESAVMFGRERDSCGFLCWHMIGNAAGECATSVRDGIGGSSSVDLFQGGECELGGGRSGLPRSASADNWRSVDCGLAWIFCELNAYQLRGG